MTALYPQITCRFWQAPYSDRPQVGPIRGVAAAKKVSLPTPAYDSDVEDDLKYGLRNRYAWVWKPLEEIQDNEGGILDDGDAILDHLGDSYLSDADVDHDPFEETA